MGMADGRTHCRDAASSVLVVEDDHQLCALLAHLLGGEGFHATFTHDAHGLRRAMGQHSFDLLLLDLGLPHGEDGVSVMRGLTSGTAPPLIVLSGRSATIDKVLCLELGAEDYVTKPFEPLELVARMRSVLRRPLRAACPNCGRAAHDDGAEVVAFAGWRLDLGCHSLTDPDGRPVSLTGHELALLAALAQRQGRVLSREQLLEAVAGRDYEVFDRSIDVLVGRVRRKLGESARDPRLIRTVRGEGYVLVAQSAA